MSDVTTEIPFEQAKDYVDNMDLSQIILKLAKQSGWTMTAATQMATVYKNYLLLVKKYGQDRSLPPSRDLDEMWHLHMLDTQRYHKDCEAIFGFYLHHQPSDPRRTQQALDEQLKLKDGFSTTQDLYQREYGDYIYVLKAGWLLRCLIAPFKLFDQLKDYLAFKKHQK